MVEKRGRPLKECSKHGQYRLRISDKDAEMLDFMSKKKGLSKAEIIRNSLRTYYNLVKYQD